MRIAHILTRADSIGGAQVHVRDLASALTALGHEVVVIAGGRGSFLDRLEQRGIPYQALRHLAHPISPIRDWRALWEIRAALKRWRPDLVCTHSSKAGFLGRVAARSLGVPAVFTAHSWSFSDGIPFHRVAIYHRLERLASRFSSRIINVSESDRQLAMRYNVCPADKLVTVHNGMPDVNGRLRSQPARHPPRLIMVARFQEPKDHPTLLEALSGLRQYPWLLDLVGNGPLEPQTERLTGQLGLADRVSFLGERQDVSERLATSDIFVLISKWEGLPCSVLEAMRAGLPVIASDVGGVCECVLDRNTGFLVPRGDVLAVRDRLGRLIGDPALRVRMGTAGRRRYQESFTFERMLNQTLTVYHEALDAHERRVGGAAPT